jgi:hypothetical protein
MIWLKQKLCKHKTIIFGRSKPDGVTMSWSLEMTVHYKSIDKCADCGKEFINRHIFPNDTKLHPENYDKNGRPLNELQQQD